MDYHLLRDKYLCIQIFQVNEFRLMIYLYISIKTKNPINKVTALDNVDIYKY